MQFKSENQRNRHYNKSEESDCEQKNDEGSEDIDLCCHDGSFCAQPMIVNAEDSDTYGDYVVTVYNEQNGLPTGEANVVLQTSDGYVWIGSYGGLIRYDGTDFKNYSEERDGIASSSVRTLFEDSRGRLWIGTNDVGIYTYERGVFSKIDNQDDHTFLCIRDFAEDKDGTIYAASNSGLAKIEGDTVIPVSDEAVDDNTIYSLGVDCYGRVWCSMNHGICTVIESGQEARQLSSDLFFDEAEIYCVSAGRRVKFISVPPGMNLSGWILKIRLLTRKLCRAG